MLDELFKELLTHKYSWLILYAGPFRHFFSIPEFLEASKAF